jgi:hypothetical protein
MARRFGCLGCLGQLVLVAVIGAAALYGVAVITDPWAFHIGGRSTPLLTWWGSGRLLTKSGEYPLFLLFYPSSHFSQLHMDGKRPTGGVQGSACLCTAAGAFESLKLGGTIYGGWRSLEDSLMDVRLNEITIIDVGQKRGGYVDLYGTWRGPELVMDDRKAYSAVFRSGLRIERASVTLRWNPWWSCKSACANAKPAPSRP